MLQKLTGTDLLGSVPFFMPKTRGRGFSEALTGASRNTRAALRRSFPGFSGSPESLRISTGPYAPPETQNAPARLLDKKNEHCAADGPVSTENGHAGRPGKTRRQSCPRKVRPPLRLPALVRHFRHGGLNFSSPGMLCPSHTPNAPLRPTAQTRQAALFAVCAAPPPPSAVPEQQTASSAMFRLRSAHRSKSFPQPRLRRIRHRSPQNFLPSRAVSPDLRADSETFCRRGPACASVPRQKPDAFAVGQGTFAPNERLRPANKSP